LINSNPKKIIAEKTELALLQRAQRELKA